MRRLRRLRKRGRRLERRFERRYPRLYDARHGAEGVARALGPLIGPLLAAAFLLPILLLLAALWALLGLGFPSIDLPSIPLKSLTFELPDWLRSVLRGLVVVAALAAGISATIRARRRRGEAELVGRPELLRRLAVTLGRIDTRARAEGAERVADISGRD